MSDFLFLCGAMVLLSCLLGIPLATGLYLAMARRRRYVAAGMVMADWRFERLRTARRSNDVLLVGLLQKELIDEYGRPALALALNMQPKSQTPAL